MLDQWRDADGCRARIVDATPRLFDCFDPQRVPAKHRDEISTMLPRS